MAHATLNDLLEVEPTIQDYGVLDWDTELERSTQEVNRILNVRWYLPYARSKNTSQAFDPERLNSAQLTQACVYHALAYHIAPKLTNFDPEQDVFSVMMKYYEGRFEHEMELVITEGVQYDLNLDGEVQASEVKAGPRLRLQR